jgi:hypothetical protein
MQKHTLYFHDKQTAEHALRIVGRGKIVGTKETLDPELGLGQDKNIVPRNQYELWWETPTRIEYDDERALRKQTRAFASNFNMGYNEPLEGQQQC